MDVRQMKEKTKKLAVRIIRFCQLLPDTPIARTINNQLVRCGTSVGANYRAACRGRSKRDFIAKLGIVEEEADEVLFWLEILMETGYANKEECKNIYEECDSILAIVVRTKKSAKGIN